MKTLKKKIVVLASAAALGVCIGAALGYGPLLSYKSEGVLSMELGTSEYKRYAELANDADAITKYMSGNQIAGLGENEQKKLVTSVVRGTWQKPVPKVSKADSKELPDFVIQLEQERAKTREGTTIPAYLGLRLTYIDRDPELAAGIARWLGGYFKDVATREAVRNQVAQWSAENQQFSDRALERKLKLRFDIEQVQTRSVALKAVMATYPQSKTFESRQVVDVRKDKDTFMSPLSQLLAAEYELINIHEQAAKIDRDIEQQTFVKALVKEADASVAKAESGRDSVLKLSNLIIDASKKIKSEAEREKLLSLAADLSQITARFLTQAQFIAPPTVPERPERPAPLMLILLGGLLALFVAVCFVWRVVILRALSQDDTSMPKSA